MAVPEQVRKQTEKVQALYAELEGDQGAQPNGEAPAPVVEPTPSEEGQRPEQPASQPEPNQPGEGNNEENQTWEQKYRTLQGMYNAEVPRLTGQVRELSERLEQMQSLVATMQSAVPKADPVPEPAPSNLTDAEREEYGESIDIMRKVSHEAVAPYVTEISRLNDVISQMQGTVIPRIDQIQHQNQQSAEQRFWSDLASAVPDWKTINDNPDFQSWLLEIDALSGHPRQMFLDDAQQNLDANRVAGFFTSWLSGPGAAQAEPNRSDATTELERQITPGRSHSAPTPQHEEAKTYTPQDIAQFYRDVSDGKFKGREDERNQLERDIFAAQAEGRIVNA